MNRLKLVLIAFYFLANFLMSAFATDPVGTSKPVPDPARLEERLFEFQTALLMADYKSAYNMLAPYMKVMSFERWKQDYGLDREEGQRLMGKLERLDRKETRCFVTEHPAVSSQFISCGVTLGMTVEASAGAGISPGELKSIDSNQLWEYIRGEWYFVLFYHGH